MRFIEATHATHASEHETVPTYTGTMSTSASRFTARGSGVSCAGLRNASWRTYAFCVGRRPAHRKSGERSKPRRCVCILSRFLAEEAPSQTSSDASGIRGPAAPKAVLARARPSHPGTPIRARLSGRHPRHRRQRLGWALLRTCGRSFIGDYKHAAYEDNYCSNYGPDH